MFDDITVSLVFSYMLVFARLGGGIMMMPALSESSMSARARLIVALGISLIILPVVKNYLPPVPNNVLMLFLIVAGEFIIGVFIGTVIKIVLSALSVAGELTSMQMGLSAAMMFDPAQKEQSSIIGVFLTFLGVLMIFTTNLHHVFLKGLVESYQLFAPAQNIPFESFAQVVGKTVSEAFLIGFKIASPQIVIGTIIYLGAGVMGRLMPQMQVFFVLLPVQIGMGLFILMITLSASMIWFIDYYSEVLANFVG